jgi:hypothetical protein
VTKSLNKNDNTTVFHHYKFDVFNVAIDQQLNEIEDRFGGHAKDLLSLRASLNPILGYFDIEKVCSLVEIIILQISQIKKECN